MSLAPASIRGFFLNARFAVNGIQCAARSFGTLTAGALGLLSRMGGLFKVLGGCWPQGINFPSRRGTPKDAISEFIWGGPAPQSDVGPGLIHTPHRRLGTERPKR